MRYVLTLLIFLFPLPLLAAQVVPPREYPPTFAPFAQIETHRIRIVNAKDGAIQISHDGGSSWQLVGRVTVPAADSIMGYLASGYAQPSTISATAVHGLRIRVGDLTSAYPKLVNILPREFAQTPKGFGGHIAGASGIYTNIPVGTGIFRELAPYAGNPVTLENADGSLTPLPLNYIPRENDTLVIVVKAPANPLRQVVFENKAGGDVTVTYADGTKQVVTTVYKPVYGVGRFDGTSYTGVGAINTNHCGVITVSTAPITTSKLFEGDGSERRGGFQIEPIFHNSQSDEAGAPMILSVGAPATKHQPVLEGTPPLFDGDISLAWDPQDTAHSWRAEVQRNGDFPWLPMPERIGNQPNALQGITAIRLIQNDTGDDKWRGQRIAAAARAYRQVALADARAGKTPIERGRITIDAAVTDPRAKIVAFYVDGEFRGLSNTSPFQFTWDTTNGTDGEYVVEARAQDENSVPLMSTRTKFWVDNTRQIAQR